MDVYNLHTVNVDLSENGKMNLEFNMYGKICFCLENGNDKDIKDFTAVLHRIKCESELTINFVDFVSLWNAGNDILGDIESLVLEQDFFGKLFNMSNCSF